MPHEPNDDTLPLDEIGPAETLNRARKERDEKDISPLDPDSMPRAEDDDVTFERSPEFHDRPDPGPRQK